MMVVVSEHQGIGTRAAWPNAPTNQPRQPFLSQLAVRQSANGVRLINQFQWRKAGQPARVIPHVDCLVITTLCLL